jgi:hypothetical protein
MNNKLKTFGLTALVTVAAMGCYNAKYDEGTITTIGGTLPAILKSEGALFGNDSVKLGNPTYVLIVDAREGQYTMQVKERDKPLVALATRLKVGDRVKFLVSCTGDFDCFWGFDKDKIGFVYSDNLTLLK